MVCPADYGAARDRVFLIQHLHTIPRRKYFSSRTRAGAYTYTHDTRTRGNEVTVIQQNTLAWRGSRRGFTFLEIILAGIPRFAILPFSLRRLAVSFIFPFFLIISVSLSPVCTCIVHVRARGIAVSASRASPTRASGINQDNCDA